jgi:hypothetical protein
LPVVLPQWNLNGRPTLEGRLFGSNECDLFDNDPWWSQLRFGQVSIAIGH